MSAVGIEEFAVGGSKNVTRRCQVSKLPFYVLQRSACTENDRLIVSRHRNRKNAEKAKTRIEAAVSRRYPGNNVLMSWHVKETA